MAKINNFIDVREFVKDTLKKYNVDKGFYILTDIKHTGSKLDIKKHKMFLLNIFREIDFIDTEKCINEIMKIKKTHNVDIERATSKHKCSITLKFINSSIFYGN